MRHRLSPYPLVKFKSMMGKKHEVVTTWPSVSRAHKRMDRKRQKKRSALGLTKEKYPIDQSSVANNPSLAFSLKLLVLLTSTDDFEYQAAFATLEELRLGDLKPFFKEHCLQVTECLITDYFNSLPWNFGCLDDFKQQEQKK